jgi:hypothetical protein
MALATTIAHASLGALFLDPKNPRLGRKVVERSPSQEEILSILRGWSLEELAQSFLKSGFWIQEALIVTYDDLPDGPVLVVLEGNRRLAALKTLHGVLTGEMDDPDFSSMLEAQPVAADDKLFAEIPYILADDRSDVDAYLGFRHVSGIKQWKPAEKAQYVVRLIDDQGYDFPGVAKASAVAYPPFVATTSHIRSSVR